MNDLEKVKYYSSIYWAMKHYFFDLNKAGITENGIKHCNLICLWIENIKITLKFRKTLSIYSL